MEETKRWGQRPVSGFEETKLDEGRSHDSPAGGPDFVTPPSVVPASVRPGLLLMDRYVLERPIGEGGMATVWKARHVRLGSAAAVKFTTRFEESAILRFEEEARTLARLGSPHIVQVMDVGVFEHTPFMIMELLQGESLGERLLATRTLTSRETVSIISQVARGLAKAHEAGVIHRDLKPDNLFLVDNAGESLVKILDFGVARRPDSMSTGTGDFVGTPQYMSPEQALNPRAVDGRSDLWSLGVITYECLVGNPPFGGRNIAHLIEAITQGPIPVPSHFAPTPLEFDGWFEKAMARQPNERFQTLDEFVGGLTRALLQERAPLVSRRSDPPPGSVTQPASEASPPSLVPTAGLSASPARVSASTLSGSETTLPGDETIHLPKTGSRLSVGLAMGGVAVLGLAVALLFLRGSGDDAQEPTPPDDPVFEAAPVLETSEVEDQNDPDAEPTSNDAITSAPSTIAPTSAPATPPPRTVPAPPRTTPVSPPVRRATPRPAGAEVRTPGPAPSPSPVPAPAPTPAPQVQDPDSDLWLMRE